MVKRLAKALGVSGQRDKVAGYSRRMETGTVPPQGVSDRGLEALSAIVDVPVERLRAAGQRLAAPPPAPGGGAPVFARSASFSAAPGGPPPAAAAAAPLEPDEVDELFTGGA